METVIGLHEGQLHRTGDRGEGADLPAGRLKAPGAWATVYEGRSISVTGETGFAARPFGVFALAEFSLEGYAIWWSATEEADRDWIRVLRFFDNRVDRVRNAKVHHLTVRCLRDPEKGS